MAWYLPAEETTISETIAAEEGNNMIISRTNETNEVTLNEINSLESANERNLACPPNQLQLQQSQTIELENDVSHVVGNSMPDLEGSTGTEWVTSNQKFLNHNFRYAGSPNC